MLAATSLLATASLLPPRPALRELPLPAKLAGGLFLFKTSVPAADRPLAGKLLDAAQSALRSDPRVTMELGSGLEAGGVFASAASSGAGSDGADERRLVLQFQVNGGNAWAQATAFGVSRDSGSTVELLDLTIANMDQAMMGQPPFEVALPKEATGSPP